MIDIKYAKIHDTSLILAGNNLKNGLDPQHREGLRIQYDKDEDVVVVWAKHPINKEYDMAIVPLAAVAYMIPYDYKKSGYKLPPEIIKPKGPVEAGQANLKIQAQVSTPTGHVFSDEPGLTGQEPTKAKLK